MTADKRNILTEEKKRAKRILPPETAGWPRHLLRCVLGAFIKRCAGDRRSHFVSNSQK